MFRSFKSGTCLAAFTGSFPGFRTGKLSGAPGLLVVCDRLGRWFAQLNVRADFLDLGGLLFELGCESLYLFLLLRDRCLQLLNFVIQHGLALGARARLRCATRRRCAKTLVVRANIPAK